jgi:hypothetical protein
MGFVVRGRSWCWRTSCGSHSGGVSGHHGHFVPQSRRGPPPLTWSIPDNEMRPRRLYATASAQSGSVVGATQMLFVVRKQGERSPPRRKRTLLRPARDGRGSACSWMHLSPFSGRIRAFSFLQAIISGGVLPGTRLTADVATTPAYFAPCWSTGAGFASCWRCSSAMRVCRAQATARRAAAESRAVSSWRVIQDRELQRWLMMAARSAA